MVGAAGDRNVWIVGGGDLAGQFADAGLLDEVIVSIAPVTLGGGAPLLPRRIELASGRAPDERGDFPRGRVLSGRALTSASGHAPDGCGDGPEIPHEEPAVARNRHDLAWQPGRRHPERIALALDDQRRELPVPPRARAAGSAVACPRGGAARAGTPGERTATAPRSPRRCGKATRAPSERPADDQLQLAQLVRAEGFR